MDRLKHDFDHNWHVAINEFNADKTGDDFRHWMYEAKRLADEVPRMILLFGKERHEKLPQLHQQCSRSPQEPVTDNHLTCCLGIECRKCPELLALDQITNATPEQIDTAKAWTCAGHILSEGGDQALEGYLLTVDDRMYWDRVYTSLAADDEIPDE